jgi:16S rRNA (cytidine1402-2'-O)-methyltransferase
VSSADLQRGALFLVPAPLDFGCAAQVPLTDVVPAGTLERAASITHWICENAKTARAYLKRIGESHPLAAAVREQHIEELPREVHKKGDEAAKFDAKPLLQPALQGHDVGLLSEAGMPAIADPGSSIVRAAHELGVRVVPLVGPGAVFLALAASGLGGQSFAFVGYLPQDAGPRAQRLRELEALAIRTGQTQSFIETPYRNAAVWRAACEALQPRTRLAIAGGLTLPDAVTACRSVAMWRGHECPVANDVPAVFAIGR